MGSCPKTKWHCRKADISHSNEQRTRCRQGMTFQKQVQYIKIAWQLTVGENVNIIWHLNMWRTNEYCSLEISMQIERILKNEIHGCLFWVFFSNKEENKNHSLFPLSLEASFSSSCNTRNCGIQILRLQDYYIWMCNRK